MTNRSLWSCLLLVLAAALPLPAFADFDAALFGMSGMVVGETARMSVTNISAPVTQPQDPRRAQLSLVDAAGNPLVNPDTGLPLVSQVTVPPGTIASVTLLAPSSAVGLPNRFTYRVVVRQVTTQTASSPGGILAASQEIFNAATGTTRVVQPQDPIQPADPHFGLFLAATPIGASCVVPGQTVRFSAVNLVQAPFPPDPCRVALRMVDTNGQTLINSSGVPATQEFVLKPGVASSLDFAPAFTEFTTTFGGNVTLARAVIRQTGIPNPMAPQCAVAPVC